MNQLLDNITWFTLTGPHAVYASGAKDVRRYAAGFSPIVGFADSARPDFASLEPWCEPDEHPCQKMGFRYYCETTLRVISRC